MSEEKLPTEKDTHNSKNAGQVLGEELLKEVTGRGAKPASRAAENLARFS